MYLEHYDFTDFPFQLTPDHTFFFDSRPHRKGMAYLTYGLSKGEGFIVITGEIGSGKTTLLNHLISSISGGNTAIAHVVNTRMQADDLLRKVASGFALAEDYVNKARLLDAIESFLLSNQRAGRRAVVIVDEAQNLSASSLEELRMLSNLQSGGRPLLQICLSGQPEFRKTLADPLMEQFRQRIIASYHLRPLDAEDTRNYIEHRLRRVGWSGTPGFDADAFQVIYEHTGGVPRKINFLMDRLLLFGCLEDKRHFRVEDVASIIDELNEETEGLTPIAAAEAERPQAVAGPAAQGSASTRELALLAQHLTFLENLLGSASGPRNSDRGLERGPDRGSDWGYEHAQPAPGGGGSREGQVQDLMQHVAHLRKRLG